MSLGGGELAGSEEPSVEEGAAKETVKSSQPENDDDVSWSCDSHMIVVIGHLILSWCTSIHYTCTYIMYLSWHPRIDLYHILIMSTL